MDKDWDRIREELDKMYTKAITVGDCYRVVQKRKKIEKEISEVELHEEPDKIGEALIAGFWAEYEYWLRRGEIDRKEVSEFLKKVAWFWRACKTEIAFTYGVLLSTGYDSLLGNKETSLKVFEDLKERAERTGNRVALLRVINRRVTKVMKEENWEEAVKAANKIEKLLPVKDDAELRHFGNIFNNRGTSKIRGDIDYLGGIRDLMMAANDFYLKEKMVPIKHILGVINRLQEGKTKIEEKKPDL